MDIMKELTTEPLEPGDDEVDIFLMIMQEPTTITMKSLSRVEGIVGDWNPQCPRTNRYEHW